ncbi:MAG: biotin--[acetyl-CoA-carboxylase] ligase [Clostridiales bacterium]|nr:biotin--[acetyl-CoA-carboxylase] ligase [Clostridiales bacterium]
MDLKQQVLGILEASRGSYVNGAMMAKKLYVSRNAVWKAVKQLKNEGYNISAVRNLGYRLDYSTDILSAESIYPYLRGKAKDFKLDVRKTVTSTNTIAKEMAVAGAPAGTVIIASEQTEGRGRMGRSFYSPASTGLYLTIILRPRLSLEDSMLITTTAAVAAANAIEKVSGKNVQIKWVNDLFVDGKKVCGILTEASLNVETGGLEYAVVGIGINITTSDFPDDIRSIAGSILSEKPSDKPVTSVLAAEVLNNLSEAMDGITGRHYLEEYRKRSFLIGEDILVLRGNEPVCAKAIDIDDRARLVVEYPDGKKEALSSGEVSIRKMKEHKDKIKNIKGPIEFAKYLY